MSDDQPQVPPDQPSAQPPVVPLSALETDWRRLDPLMLLIHPAHALVRVIPVLVIALVLRQSQGRADYRLELVVVLAVVALGMVKYLTTRFRIHNGQIELQTGLLNKNVIATPADRVRTVDVTAPLLHRVFGLAKVDIATAGAGKRSLVLDALPIDEAGRLREELIHRRTEVSPADGTDRAPAAADQSLAQAPAPVETTLLVLDPLWVRFAPLTSAGWVLFGAALIAGSQYLQYAGTGNLRSQLSSLEGALSVVVVAVALVGIAVTVCVLAVVAYFLQNWGFRLTRHAGGTIHAARGLLTTRATSIEEKRIRGVELGEPLGLRLARGGRLVAITTGLTHTDNDRGRAFLVPPAPMPVVTEVARLVVQDEPAVTAMLTPHGPAARRRRYTRAVLPLLVLAAVLVWVVVRQGWPTTVALVAVLPLLAAPFLARDRYAGLGHHLSPSHLVVRSGSLTRRRDVLQRDGIIGFNQRRTFFQRRSGVSNLSATTAAGKQSYTAYDIPLDQGVALALEIDPALVGQFVQR